MPEINPFKKDFIKNVSSKKNEGGFVDSGSFEEIVKESRMKKIGSGSECFVVEDPGNKEKAIAINYKNLSPEDAKDIYYSSKIWSTLFPHNFPKIHSASALSEDDEFNGTIREKVDGKTLHEQQYSFNQMMNSDFEKKGFLSSAIRNVKNYLLNKKTETSYSFADAFREMETLNKEPYNLPFFIDGNTKNFIKTDDGDEYYVDTMRMGSRLEDRVNIDAIKDYMTEKNYGSSDISKVTNSLARLNDLFINKSQ